MDHGTRFNRGHGFVSDDFTYIGPGDSGGKAAGLAFIKEALERAFPTAFRNRIQVGIPATTVLRTGVFDQFMAINKLYDMNMESLPDDWIAHDFQRAELPTTVLGDLLSLITHSRRPLAIRSSSLMEDAIYNPFAGVYATKMIPNNQADSTSRFKKMVEAIKFVYASTFFENARNYCQANGRDYRDEKMAVMIQNVQGTRHGDVFYPAVSGVARSYNFYACGRCDPEGGVASLALGLGKTIVDGGRCWTYSPKRPTAPPPCNSIGDLLDSTQSRFWAINMNPPRMYAPDEETEYLLDSPLKLAEEDAVLKHLCSTYSPQADRLYAGAFGNGPRLLNFASLLSGQDLPLNDLILELLHTAEVHLNENVEIEFAMTLPKNPDELPRLGFLQVRPMVVSDQTIQCDTTETDPERIVICSKQVLGNGQFSTIRDIVYVKRDTFRPAATQDIAKEIAQLNQILSQQKTPYLLVGFGRWGSSEPWLGIPVSWSQISGASVIVEATLPTMRPDMSQGSHFFHNITSMKIPYFSVADNDARASIDWDWLDDQHVLHEIDYVRHVRTEQELTILVDGRMGTGMVLK